MIILILFFSSINNLQVTMYSILKQYIVF